MKISHEFFDRNSKYYLKNPEPIIVVLAADDNYAMQVAVVCRSILENLQHGRNLILYVIDGGIRNFNKSKILKSLNLPQDRIEWLNVYDKLTEKNLKISDHVTIATYFRLIIPELLPHHYKKAIYLDSDLIVNQDLSKLWDIDIREYYLLAVQDAGIPYVSSAKGLINYKELEILPECKYFNAGVLVINLEKWRLNNTSQQVINYLEKNQNFVRWWDQDGLNAILAGCWGELDRRWNQTPGIYEYSSWQESPFSEEIYNNLIYNPYIIHFAKAGKPWNSREDHPANSLFFQYVDMTAWSGWRFTIWRRFWRRLVRDIKQFLRF